MAVPQLDKPRGAWCQHCHIGVGCKIYEARPEVCRGYPCLWNMQHKLPDDLRPDRIKVVFESLTSSRTCLAIVDPDQPDAWRKPRARWLIQKLLREGVAVVVTCDGNGTIVLAPAGRTVAEVWRDVVAEHRARVAA